MGRDWDRSGIAFNPETWAALAEHLHPGAFGMAFAAARGWHRLAVAIEDAGLIIHPSIFGWAYGSGFPKATRIDTQVDRAAGAERKVVGSKAGRPGYSLADNGRMNEVYGDLHNPEKERSIEQPATPEAAAWEGHRYGLQAMKPALEPIIVFQKPYKGKPWQCITETGAGALNIDGGRVSAQEEVGAKGWWGFSNEKGWNQNSVPNQPTDRFRHNQGRWPANFTLTHYPDCQRTGTRRVNSKNVVRRNKGVSGAGWKSIGYADTKDDFGYADEDGKETIAAWDCVPECPVRRLGEQSGESKSPSTYRRNADSENQNAYSPGIGEKAGAESLNFGDKGTAARFFYNADYTLDKLEAANPAFYCAKASRAERDAGLDGRNPHPTLKPLTLTRWLATLLLPPDEYAPRRLLVPFAGSGSEMIGGALAGWEHIVGVELEAESCDITRARLAWWAGWSEKTGESDPKELLKRAKKNGRKGKKGKKRDEKQMKMDLEE
jgi:site-specific DNA-methyltransferase (adenine-specific)